MLGDHLATSSSRLSMNLKKNINIYLQILRQLEIVKRLDMHISRERLYKVTVIEQHENVAFDA